ncbi:MAG: biopolymer transporter ExbD [Gelidibacter sp.]|nr:biopolymer transporter ExbD [Gelidibacter sp.]
MRHHTSPQVNAGSMADIAFLLLIFFLVTTTISADKGINRKLPADCPPGVNCTADIYERNVLRIAINGNDEIFVEDKIVPIKELKDVVKLFLDNNGDKSCGYCKGLSDHLLSDNPSKAIVSLTNDKLTSYEMYVGVQDILTQAYYELRDDYALTIIGKSSNNLTDSELNQVRKAYPFIISEAETK